MSKRITYYTIALYDINKNVTSFNICDFLNQLQEKIINGEITRSYTVGDKTVKIFNYNRSDINGNEKFIIPFGTPKSGFSYVEDENGDISPLTSELYDITLLYFDAVEGVCVLTSDLGAPTYKSIQICLNNIINSEDYILLINPIIHYPDYEAIRNAEEELYNQGVQDDNNVFTSLKNAIGHFRDAANAKTFTFELKLENHARKNATMNVDCVLDIISKFNIQSDIVKEIELQYRNNTAEKYELAKLKDNGFIITDNFENCRFKSLTAGFLLDNIQRSLDAKRRFFSRKVREMNRNVVTANITIFR